jgi:hypothetical protein
MTEKEEAVFEKELSSVLTKAAVKEEAASAPKKARKAYEWTEKRAEAFQKMRDGLALKVEVASQLKREKKEMEKKDIKERIAKIMNSAKKTKTKKMDSSSEEEEKPDRRARDMHMNSSESESEQDSKLMIRKHSHKGKGADREEPRKSKNSSKRKEKEAVIESDSESAQSSSSEEENFELASAKQKQHYRDAKIKIGKAQKSTRTLNALDNYILL